jgi:cystathionine beta-lyase
LVKSAEHGFFGYSEPKDGYYNAVINWFSSRFSYTPKKEWFVKTPGIVYAIATAINAFTEKGDAVLIQRPVYYPFSGVIINNGRQLVNNPLVYSAGVYSIDLDDFEQKIVQNKVKLFILCSPHNPVGRVWSKDELAGMGKICQKHGVIVVSDEIHCDFTYGGQEHTVFASVSEEFAGNSIICTAPSKTFNLAGLQVSNIFIKNPILRKKFIGQINKTGYSQLNTMGLIACQTVYEGGGKWLDELIVYLEENYKFLKDFLAENIPEVKVIPLEGTYLVWLDFSKWQLNKSVRTQKELDELIINKAGLWLDSGTIFGIEGEGFQRINIACPRETLAIALEKLCLI